MPTQTHDPCATIPTFHSHTNTKHHTTKTKLLQLTNQQPQSLQPMATSVVTPLVYIKRDKEGGRGWEKLKKIIFFLGNVYY